MPPPNTPLPWRQTTGPVWLGVGLLTATALLVILFPLAHRALPTATSLGKPLPSQAAAEAPHLTTPALAALAAPALDPRFQITYWNDIKRGQPEVWRAAVNYCAPLMPADKSLNGVPPNCMPVVLIYGLDQLASDLQQAQSVYEPVSRNLQQASALLATTTPPTNNAGERRSPTPPPRPGTGTPHAD